MDDIRQILVPVDFSEYCSIASAKAWHLAEKHDANVHLLHVLTETPYSFPTPESQRTKVRRSQENLDRLLPPWGEMQQQVFRLVRMGNPYEQIIEYAQQKCIDLIIMGTHGRSGVSRAVLGSVADRVVRSAPCPVMTVRADPSRDRIEEAISFEEIETPADELLPGLDLVKRGVAMRASDIHIDPGTHDAFEVRMRIDGQLQHYCNVDRDVAGHLIGQFKTLADLPIAEPFRPLEGRLRMPLEFANLEIRMTSAPVAGGEAVALRVFDRSQMFRPVEDLGFSESGLHRVQEMMRRSEGIVLVTGPTNAGKTTTVYSMLEAIGGANRNIISIEDPVELSAPFVRQMAVDVTHGITMKSGLRTILRMDPDVVFVGEIRDAEAAEMATRAASSGRYVLSTLHTRDVAATITALRDFGIDNRSLAGNLTGIINQRLIRQVCKECFAKRAPNYTEREHFSFSSFTEVPDKVVDAVGCDACRGTGYRGRTGVFETLVADEEFRAAIADGMPENGLEALIREKDTPSLTTDALIKASNLVTSVSEALELRWL
jgi:type II secretory ATPase GspE/PulE/Tfp pilus assembly ATPase PilB-like protein/nucleotide-binding universal stress UspA family protein